MENEDFDDCDEFSEEINSVYNCSENLTLIKQGAEARLFKAIYFGRDVVVKERFAKQYRNSTLDDYLTKERMKSEIRCIHRCHLIGIQTPPLYFVDTKRNRIIMGFVDNAITVRDYIINVQNQNSVDLSEALAPLAQEIGRIVAVLHENHIVHGDLTTSNMLIRRTSDKIDIVMIDFGLSYTEQLIEDKAVDLYVLEKAFISTHPNSEDVFQKILDSYVLNFTKNIGGKKVLSKLADVRLRGRKRLMIG